VAETPIVDFIEGRADALASPRNRRSSIAFGSEIPDDVADIEEALERHRIGGGAFAEQQFAALRRSCGQDAADFAEVDLPATVVRAHVVVAQVRHQHAERREVPGTRGMISVGMCSSRAISAECSGPAPPNDHREVARIVTALDRDAAHCKRHFRHGNFDDAERGGFDRKTSGAAIVVRIAARAPSTSSGISPRETGSGSSGRE